MFVLHNTVFEFIAIDFKNGAKDLCLSYKTHACAFDKKRLSKARIHIRFIMMLTKNYTKAVSCNYYLLIT